MHNSFSLGACSVKNRNKTGGQSVITATWKAQIKYFVLESSLGLCWSFTALGFFELWPCFNTFSHNSQSRSAATMMFNGDRKDPSQKNTCMVFHVLGWGFWLHACPFFFFFWLCIFTRSCTQRKFYFLEALFYKYLMILYNPDFFFNFLCLSHCVSLWLQENGLLEKTVTDKGHWYCLFLVLNAWGVDVGF